MKKKPTSKERGKREWITPELRDYLSYEYMPEGVPLSDAASLVDQIKYQLCAQIVRYHISNEIPRNDLAEKLGIDAPEMSRLLRYKIDRYTIDRLIRYVEVLYPALSIDVHAA